MSYESLSHSRWDCKYHVVFIPKRRKKELYGKIRKFLGPVFRELIRQKESELVEGHMMPDHVHMLVKVPPKYAVAEMVGYVKGKSAIAVARQFSGRQGISMVRDFGHEDTRYRRSGSRRNRSGGIFGIKKSLMLKTITRTENFE